MLQKPPDQERAGEGNLEVHRIFLRPEGRMFLNSASSDNGRVNATELAKQAGSLVIANLALLGYALKSEALFCSAADIEEVVCRRISPPKQLELSLKGLRLGLETR
jgi:indolepyruvate ferredoxin oxidoreductase beta subunit